MISSAAARWRAYTLGSTQYPALASFAGRGLSLRAKTRQAKTTIAETMWVGDLWARSGRAQSRRQRPG